MEQSYAIMHGCYNECIGDRYIMAPYDYDKNGDLKHQLVGEKKPGHGMPNNFALEFDKTQFGFDCFPSNIVPFCPLSGYDGSQDPAQPCKNPDLYANKARRFMLPPETM